MPNESGVEHDLRIEGSEIATPIVTSGVAEGEGEIAAGEYEFFCSVPGHREGGMVGTLTVE
jgi:plastocyanin